MHLFRRGLTLNWKKDFPCNNSRQYLGHLLENHVALFLPLEKVEIVSMFLRKQHEKKWVKRTIYSNSGRSSVPTFEKK